MSDMILGLLSSNSSGHVDPNEEKFILGFDEYMNAAMIIIFFIEIVLLSVNSVRSLRSVDNRNIYNVIEYVSIFACLATHIGYLIYSIIYNESVIFP